MGNRLTLRVMVHCAEEDCELAYEGRVAFQAQANTLFNAFGIGGGQSSLEFEGYVLAEVPEGWVYRPRLQETTPLAWCAEHAPSRSDNSEVNDDD